LSLGALAPGVSGGLGSVVLVVLDLLAGFEQQLGRAVAVLEVECLHGEDARRLVQAVSRVEARLAALRLVAARRAADCGVWRRAGFKSAEEWLSSETGVPVSSARKSLRTAEQLQGLPEVAEQGRQGAVSERQLERIVDAAAGRPQRQRDLLDAARRRSFSGLASEADRVKAEAQAEQERRRRYRRILDQRHVRRWTDAGGAGHVELVDTVDRCARLFAVVQARGDLLFRQARRQGRRVGHGAYLADALVSLAEEPGPTPPRLTDGVDGAFPPDVGGVLVPDTDGDASEAGGGGGQPPNRLSDTLFPGLAGAAHAGRGHRPDTLFPELSGAGSRRQADRADADGADDPGAVDAGGAAGAGAGSAGAGSGGVGSGGGGYGGAGSGGAGGGRRGGRGKRSRGGRQARRAAETGAVVTFVVDLEAFHRGCLLPGERCEIPGVGPVPLVVVERYLGSAWAKLVITKGRDIRTICHLGRTINSHLRSALEVRDPVCVVPGCNASLNLEIDHIVAVNDHGPTCLDNLVRLCPYHHDQKTYDGYTITHTDGHWHWHPPANDPPRRRH
jgi:hypothetical protein